MGDDCGEGGCGWQWDWLPVARSRGATGRTGALDLSEWSEEDKSKAGRWQV
jgi:hypothetical protein